MRTNNLTAAGKPKELEDYLREVDYATLNSSSYEPSAFALNFMNFIKLVNGSEGEANKTPPFHLKMLDKIADEDEQYVLNLCFRGSGKALATSTPMLTPEGWSTMADLGVGDSVYGEDGKPTKILYKSEVFDKPMYKLTLGDGRELAVCEEHINVVIRKRVGRKEGKCYTYYERSEVSTKDLLDIKLTSTRSKTKNNPRGMENLVWIPTNSAVVHEPKELPIDPYLLGIILGDGSVDRATGFTRLHTHKDDYHQYESYLGDNPSIYVDKRNPNIWTIGIKGIGKLMLELGLNVHGDYKKIPDIYFTGSIEQRLALLQGLMDTDGTVDGASPTFSSNSIELCKGVQYLTYSLGGIGKLTHKISASGKDAYRVNINLDMPVFRLERKQKRNTARVLNKVPLVSVEAIENIPSQCIAVDNESKTFLGGEFVVTHNTTLMMEYLTLYIAMFNYLPGYGEVTNFIYISDSIENGVKNARENIEFRYNNSDFLQEWLPYAKITETQLEFGNKDGKRLGVKMYGSKSGLRGNKMYGKRPQIAILDDLVGDKDANSKATMDLIKNTLYKGVFGALDPNHKIIFNGTPFNKEDVILEALESGQWSVNVWPVCQEFPVSAEHFHGAWEGRFTYDAINKTYGVLNNTGRPDAFFQEFMLQITSDEDRLVQDSEIKWVDLETVMKNKHNFNFYITTDFATSSKTTADNSVISVWAYSSNGDWFYVDGFCERTTMNVSINRLFEFVQKYSPQSVGVEISGQQGAFIDWLQREMIIRNIWFNFASSTKNSHTPGIRPIMDKLSRFNLIVPMFKMGKMYFPKQLKDDKPLTQGMSEIRLTTKSGIKGKDDFLDTISMLGYMNPWKPAKNAEINSENGHNYWDTSEENNTSSGIDSYIV